jgi:hypothetical protein
VNRVLGATGADVSTAPVVNGRAEKKFPLTAIKSVQDFGQQREDDDRSDRDQRDASCFTQSPKRIGDHSHGRARRDRFRGGF